MFTNVDDKIFSVMLPVRRPFGYYYDFFKLSIVDYFEIL